MQAKPVMPAESGFSEDEFPEDEFPEEGALVVTKTQATKPTAGSAIIPNLVVPSEKKEFQPDVPKGIVDKQPERSSPEPQQSE
jgi:hypothetical protein